MNNSRAFRGLSLAGLVTLGLVAMTPALAESQFTTGAGANLQANARLDFQVVIPRFISFQVGSANAAVDKVVFNVAAANVGSGGTAVGPTSGSPVAVTLKGNGGAINLTADTTGTSLTSGVDIIPFTQINSITSSGTITAPTLVENGVSAAVAVPVSLGRVTDRSATWSYTYANTAIVGAGTYDGQVKYTATMP